MLLIRRIQRSNVDPHTDVDTTGVLQIAWLLGSEPRLARVERPELEALRIAGMYDVDPHTLRYRRMGSSMSEKSAEDADEEQWLDSAGPS